jgi:elongation factor P hydroxylase
VTAAVALEEVFHDCFLDDYNTRLQGGAGEPLYRPAAADSAAVIYYRHDYSASLLHEVAHWCIAGPARRTLEDYGYWYSPDGRDTRQQRAFESVEVRPQALEWHFALACGQPFRVSQDNLSLQPAAGERFRCAVLDQARRFCAEALPPRALQFRSALAQRFGGTDRPASELFIGTGCTL